MLIAFLLPSLSAAQTVSYGFTATIEVADPPLDTVFTPGERLTVYFQLDSAVPDLDPSPGIGDYENAVLMSSAFTDDYVVTGTGGNLLISDMAPGNFDIFIILGFVSGPAIAGGCVPDTAQAFATDSTGLAFSNDAFPVSAPDPTNFDVFDVKLNFACPGGLASLTAFGDSDVVVFINGFGDAAVRASDWQ